MALIFLLNLTCTHLCFFEIFHLVHFQPTLMGTHKTEIANQRSTTLFSYVSSFILECGTCNDLTKHKILPIKVVLITFYVFAATLLQL